MLEDNVRVFTRRGPNAPAELPVDGGGIGGFASETPATQLRSRSTGIASRAAGAAGAMGTSASTPNQE
ncbi:hypothetical protein [Streptomyces sp. NPDC127072]|uniref:hypothetical protein n=1 Tax=Streptomyces sp. NPDC127072 TaxID=3347129 RepID=UPI00365A41DD